MKERGIVIDIEGCVDHTVVEEETAVSLTVSVDELAGESQVIALQWSNAKRADGGGGLQETTKKEKSKSMSAKKPPKPPRPPRGLSLDAADQRLIKELSELAMIKRARMERIKALKKMKAVKAASTSSASAGNLMAMLFTILFCVVIIFRVVCHPPGVLLMNSIPTSQKFNEDQTQGRIVMVGITHEQHATLWGRISQRNDSGTA